MMQPMALRLLHRFDLASTYAVCIDTNKSMQLCALACSTKQIKICRMFRFNDMVDIFCKHHVRYG